MKFRVLINSAGVYVKDAEFFESQGGLTKPWGKKWEEIDAIDLRQARQVAIAMRRQRFPHSHRTQGEILPSSHVPFQNPWPRAQDGTYKPPGEDPVFEANRLARNVIAFLVGVLAVAAVTVAVLGSLG